MNNNTKPDFSVLDDVQRNIQEATYDAMQPMLRIQEILRPVLEYLDQYKIKIAESMQEVSRIMRPLDAINKMGSTQFVFWRIMSNDFMNALIESEDSDKPLCEIVEQNEWAGVYSTIEEIRESPLMKSNLRLYNQAVSAFVRNDYDLAVVGFTSALDGILSKVSSNPTHRLQPRIEVIKEKLERDDILENEEYAMLTLALTLEATLESFSKTAPFTEPEPKGLNRHWIAHGRSTRRKTKLDCIKLIRLIYGLLLIYELDTQKTALSQ